MTISAPTPVTSSELTAAYLAAAEREAARTARGAVIVGHKVGFTNMKTWPLIGATRPMWGAMYNDTVIEVGGGSPFRCSLAAYHGPRLEPEIVVHFSKAPPADASLEDLLDCIDWMAQGYELVLSPNDSQPASVSYAISNGGMHGALLLGAPRRVADLGPDLAERLATLEIELRCNDELQEAGNSAAVLGNPLNAVLFLLKSLAEEGRPPVGAGHLITTGTMTAAYPVAAGQRWSTTLSGLDLPNLDVLFE